MVVNRALGILLFLCISDAVQGQTCGLIAMDFGWNEQLPIGINDAGVIVANGYNSEGGPDESDVFTWQQGVVTELPGLGGGFKSASAINNNNKVVGYAQDLNGIDQPVTWATTSRYSDGTARAPLVSRLHSLHRAMSWLRKDSRPASSSAPQARKVGP